MAQPRSRRTEQPRQHLKAAAATTKHTTQRNKHLTASISHSSYSSSNSSSEEALQKVNYARMRSVRERKPKPGQHSALKPEKSNRGSTTDEDNLSINEHAGQSRQKAGHTTNSKQPVWHTARKQQPTKTKPVATVPQQKLMLKSRAALLAEEKMARRPQAKPKPKPSATPKTIRTKKVACEHSRFSCSSNTAHASYLPAGTFSTLSSSASNCSKPQSPAQLRNKLMSVKPRIDTHLCAKRAVDTDASTASPTVSAKDASERTPAQQQAMENSCKELDQMLAHIELTTEPKPASKKKHLRNRRATAVPKPATDSASMREQLATDRSSSKLQRRKIVREQTEQAPPVPTGSPMFSARKAESKYNDDTHACQLPQNYKHLQVFDLHKRKFVGFKESQQQTTQLGKNSDNQSDMETAQPSSCMPPAVALTVDNLFTVYTQCPMTPEDYKQLNKELEVPLAYNPATMSEQQRQALSEMLTRANKLQPSQQRIIDVLNSTPGHPAKDTMRIMLQTLPMALLQGESPYSDKFWTGYRYLRERQKLREKLPKTDMRYSEVKIMRNRSGEVFLSKTLDEELKEEKAMLDFMDTELEHQECARMLQRQKQLEQRQETQQPLNERKQKAMKERAEMELEREQVARLRREAEQKCQQLEQQLNNQSTKYKVPVEPTEQLKMERQMIMVESRQKTKMNLELVEKKKQKQQLQQKSGLQAKNEEYVAQQKQQKQQRDKLLKEHKPSTVTMSDAESEAEQLQLQHEQKQQPNQPNKSEPKQQKECARQKQLKQRQETQQPLNERKLKAMKERAEMELEKEQIARLRCEAQQKRQQLELQLNNQSTKHEVPVEPTEQLKTERQMIMVESRQKTKINLELVEKKQRKQQLQQKSGLQAKNEESVAQQKQQKQQRDKLLKEHKPSTVIMSDAESEAEQLQLQHEQKQQPNQPNKSEPEQRQLEKKQQQYTEQSKTHTEQQCSEMRKDEADDANDDAAEDVYDANDDAEDDEDVDDDNDDDDEETEEDSYEDDFYDDFDESDYDGDDDDYGGAKGAQTPDGDSDGDMIYKMSSDTTLEGYQDKLYDNIDVQGNNNVTESAADAITTPPITPKQQLSSSKALQDVTMEREKFEKKCLDSGFYHNHVISEQPWMMLAKVAHNISSNVEEIVEDRLNNSINNYISHFINMELTL